MEYPDTHYQVPKPLTQEELDRRINKIKGIRVLSLFDGIATARVALEKAGINVGIYYASEVDSYAVAISRKNWPSPKVMQLGDVQGIHGGALGDIGIDLLIGGSPCQDLSIARQSRKGLDGEKSKLFWEYVRILKEVKPKYFILENVASMSHGSRKVITEALGVEPIMIDAALVGAQNRKRLFWTNIPNVVQPANRGIVLRDIVDLTALRKWILPANIIKTRNGIRWDSSGKGHFSQNDRAYSLDNKHPTVPTARTNTKVKFVADNGASVGILNWDEVEALQGLPRGYTDLGPDNRLEKRGGVIGNAFHVDVIAHILSFIP